MTREEALEAIKGWDFLNEQEREAIEILIPELKKDDRERIKENCIHFLELQKSHHASTVEIDECIDWIKGLVPPKWLYRLEYKDGTCGLWYNGEGKWCFEQGIGSLVGCKTKDLPMDHDERYKQDGRDWFSSCSNKEDLLHWYSLNDAEELIKKGFVFTRYLATEYHEYENETVFIKDSSLVREEIDIFELFGKTKPMFKEGDWIIYKDDWTMEEDVLVVSNPDPNGTSLYTVKGEQKYYLDWDSLKTAKLWTLQDAKPGDVLVAQYTTFIFKGLKPKGKDNLVEYFVTTDKVDGSLLIGPDEYMVKDCEPAIKSQRDHLFRKIKEAGYEWDEKAKKLVNSTLKEKEEIDTGFTKMMKKSEDKKMIENIISDLNELKENETNEELISDYEREIEWLKEKI